jgi:hypothetical protein
MASWGTQPQAGMMDPIGTRVRPLHDVSRLPRSASRTLTGRLVEVALQDMLVEDEQSFENLESVLVGRFLPDLVVEVLIRQRLFRLQSLE